MSILKSNNIGIFDRVVYLVKHGKNDEDAQELQHLWEVLKLDIPGLKWEYCWKGCEGLAYCIQSAVGGIMITQAGGSLSDKFDMEITGAGFISPATQELTDKIVNTIKNQLKNHVIILDTPLYEHILVKFT